MCKAFICWRIGLLVFFAQRSLLAGEGKPDTSDAEARGITGTIRYHDRFPSQHVDPRNVDVWLPPSYAKKPDSHYPVIYMHDGQNLFDPRSSFIGVDWGVDETMTALIEAGQVDEAIVVGIWNTPKRMQEYLPKKLIESLKGTPRYKELLERFAGDRVGLEKKDLLSDEYLRFIVEELKPFIDKRYRTRPQAEHTFIMGSSAGALISLYAISEYPNVFGGAACLSTHWPLADGAMIDYIADKLPDPATHKLYFDFGTETLDKAYEPYQEKMDKVLAEKKYERDRNWMTRKFAGAEHSERAWRKRVDIPLRFLLGNKKE